MDCDSCSLSKIFLIELGYFIFEPIVFSTTSLNFIEWAVDIKIQFTSLSLLFIYSFNPR